jgi:hypothetical protein
MRLAAAGVIGLSLVAVALTLAAESSRSAGLACAPGYRPCLPVRADLDCGRSPMR